MSTLAVSTAKSLLEEVKADALAKLRQKLTPGTTLYTVDLNTKSDSYLFQVLLPTIDRNGKPAIEDITWMVSRTLGSKLAKNSSGFTCGYSASQMVILLGQAVFPEGFDVPDGMNFPRTSVTAPGADPAYESNGGYALKSENL